jgi:MFS transporter, DHA1 family, tetracycline resistance protein
MQKTRQAAIPFILITLLIDVLGFGLVIPVLPSIVGQFTSSLEGQAYWYGVLSSVYGLMQFFFAPLLGALSDQFGRRPILLISLFGLAVDYLLFAFAPSLAFLFVARVIGGITAANFTVANAYIADITPPEKRAQSFGLLGAVFGLGFILGPILGGLLGNGDPRLPFFVAAGLSAINWLYGFFVLPESHKQENRVRFSWKKANPFSSLYALSSLKTVGGLVWVSALSNLAAFILQTTWILYTTFRFSWTPKDNGIALFLVGVVSAVVQGGLIRVLLPKLGERRAILIGLLVGALSYLGYGLAQQGWVMYVIIIATFLSPLAGPAAQAIISRSISEKEQGAALGALSSLNSLMGVAAPLIGTALLGQVSHLERSNLLVGAPFFLSTLLALAALAVAFMTLKKTSEHIPEHLTKS